MFSYNQVLVCKTGSKERPRFPSQEFSFLVDFVTNLRIYEYLSQELNPFPELPVFEPMRALHNTLCSGRSLADEFVQVHPFNYEVFVVQ